jgi:predicted unusual protein kinase regulating ubiquinone biosynthesis (AarF/ABC1/UbiB family)
LNFKTITDGLGAVLYEYPFNVPAYYALILRSLTVLEGLALFTDPNFKVPINQDKSRSITLGAGEGIPVNSITDCSG